MSFRKIGDVVLKGKIESVGLYTPVLEEELNNGLYQDYLKTYDAITNAESGVLELVEQMCQKYPQAGTVILDRLASAVSSRWQNAHEQVRSILENGLNSERID